MAVQLWEEAEDCRQGGAAAAPSVAQQGQEIQILGGATDRLVRLVVGTNREELGEGGSQAILSKQKGGKAVCLLKSPDEGGAVESGVEMEFSVGITKRCW